MTPVVPETTQEAKLVGRLVSFNKETKRGLFATGNGARVQYVYTGGDPIGFNAVFGFSGAVKISGIAYFDENLVLKHIDISGAIIVQASFEFPPNTEEKVPIVRKSAITKPAEHERFKKALASVLSASPKQIRDSIAQAKSEKPSPHKRYTFVPEEDRA